MKPGLIQQLRKADSSNHKGKARGFSLTEALISLSVGTLVIGTGAMALNSTQKLIKSSGNRTNHQQNTANGIRLMRSEIERSLHTLVNGTPPDEELAYTDLGQYSEAIDACQNIANGLDPDNTQLTVDQQAKFVPLFGLKMSDVTGQPVLYGMSQGSGAKTFSIQRCGTPLGMDGRYDNTKSPFVAKVIDGISMMPCLSFDEDGKCDDINHPFADDEIREITSNDVLRHLVSEDFYDFAVNNNTSPARQYFEPRFRFETDSSRKLIRIISPMDCEEATQVCVKNTEIATSGFSGEGSRQNLLLTAYARADKRLMTPDQDGQTLSSEWFRDVNSQKVRFLVDGSGSMSACMSWSYDENGALETGNTTRIFHTPQDDPLYQGNPYESSQAICNETRMERLQRELSELIQQLPEDTKISLEVFSTEGYTNNRIWDKSKDGLVTIGYGDNRESALKFVSSFDDSPGNTWGGTDPWEGLNRSFEDSEADTLYFLSDGLPTTKLFFNGGEASYSNSYKPAADYYAKLNDERTSNQLKVNTTSVMLSSEWMEDLSDLTSGVYLQSQ